MSEETTTAPGAAEPAPQPAPEKWRYLKDRPLISLVIIFLAGLLAGFYLAPAFWPWLAGLGLLVLALWYPLKKSNKLFWWCCVISFAVGLLRAQHQQMVSPDDLRNFITLERQECVVTGRVMDAPEYNKAEKKISFVFLVEQKGEGSAVQACRGRVRANVYQADRPPDLFYGDRLKLSGKFFAPYPPTNPGEFDYKKYLALHHVYGFISVPFPDRLVFLGKGSAFSLVRAAQVIGKKLAGLLDQSFEPANAALLKGILFSDRTDLSSKVRRDFSITGLAYVLSVAGLHVNLVGACFFMLFRLFGVSRRRAVLGLFGVVFLYALITGWQAPVWRAGCMFLLWGLAILLDRETDFFVSLSFAALIILLFDPSAIFLLSFQLSFLATLAIFSLGLKARQWARNFRRSPEIFSTMEQAEVNFTPSFWDKALLYPGVKKMKWWLVDSLLISLSIQVVLLPLLAHEFYYVPCIVVLANLLVIPWMGLLIGLGLLVCGAGLVSAGLSQGLGWLAGTLVKSFQGFVSVCASLPFSHFAVARFPLGFVFAFYLTLGFSVWNPLSWQKKYLAGLLVLWAAVFAGWQVGFQMTRPKLQVFFLDVGQGDCEVAVVSGKPIVIDAGLGGSFDNGERVVTPFLYSQGLRKIAAVVMTHAHEDHVGGLPAVLENFPVGTVLDNGASQATSRDYVLFLKKIRDKKIPYYHVQQGEEWAGRLGLTGASFKILNPDAKAKGGLRSQELDDQSVVARLRAQGLTILFTGDIKKSGQRRMLREVPDAREWRADLLKVAHHGADSAAYEPLMRAVQPKEAVIEAGRNNRFGFPRDSCLRELKEAGARVWRTDLDGVVCFESSEKGYKISSIR